MTRPVATTGESLRERKKRRTRATLAANAQRLFRERGFDRVTVAEIAESADVSVKTLFVYFGSKEDLVFADEFDLLDQIRERLATRSAGTTACSAIRELAHELAAQPKDDDEGVVAFARLIGDHPALHSRLQLMWETYEQALAETLAAEDGTDPLDARTRAAAAMLITPWRVLTSTDVRNRITDNETATWIDTCFDLVDAGLGTHRPRP
jgi:AcrR family transcriptional regulator